MTHIEQLLWEVKESLEREPGAQAVHLERHAGLGQTRARWSGRMDVWAKKVDAALEANDREIAEPRERLIKLECKSA